MGAPETVLAYADPDFSARFGNAPEGDQSVDHELNDAWLGMNVTSENGEVLGYVVDAILGPDGEVTDLVITDDPNSEVEVYVPARLATLTDSEVQLSLNANDVAALRTAYDSVLASSE
ncbi:PRC-barrel domain-containing protein [Pseudohoeflea suaedae]|uniref:PRC-barrel domain-containing protein n=1 Tax=Pseudohoeflea suaedae TaxID=877384 RepID=UPI001304AD5B|nr:PRC-barrel domain-containing protein [Pseudohoeflea suaedae]